MLLIFGSLFLLLSLLKLIQGQYAIFNADRSLSHMDSRISTIEPEFLSIYENISVEYNTSHPSKHLQVPIPMLKPHHFLKRCSLLEPRKAIESFLNGAYAKQSNGKLILIQTSCLGDDSLGNMLGNYFESIACAANAGVNYMAISKIYDPKLKDQESQLLKFIPHILLNHGPMSNSSTKSVAYIRQHCSCPSSCHERSTALWPHSIPMIRNIIQYSVQNYMKLINGNGNAMKYIVRKEDVSTVPEGTELPFIPNAAVHYRCGDNFVGEYGFLTFNSISSKIKKHFNNDNVNNIKDYTIHVMAENRSRKTIGIRKKGLAEKCDVILDSLHKYLIKEFPTIKAIIVSRGGDINMDFARLSLSPVTICSVSTFCLWPAIGNINKGGVYFPKTKLILGGNWDIFDLGFLWIDQAAVIKGAPYLLRTAKDLLQRLN
jgi:hypothetical protein